MTVISMSPEQFDMLVSTILLCTCGIVFCLGILAHESGAK